MFAGVLAWLARGGLGGIANELRQAQKDRLDAANDANRLAAEKHIATIEARMEAQTRGEATWLPKLVRGMFALPFIIYLNKIIVWDKVLGWGVTDDLSDNAWRIFTVVVTFYFLDSTIKKVRK